MISFRDGAHALFSRGCWPQTECNAGREVRSKTCQTQEFYQHRFRSVTHNNHSMELDGSILMGA